MGFGIEDVAGPEERYRKAKYVKKFVIFMPSIKPGHHDKAVIHKKR
jgi:hypothetical protein